IPWPRAWASSARAKVESASILTVSIGSIWMATASPIDLSQPFSRRDGDRAAGSKQAQQRNQRRPRYRNAPRRRRIIGPRDVEKDRAAGARDDRVNVVADDHEHVVDRVLPPQRLVARRIGQGYEPVVGRVGGVVDPTVAGAERGQRQ